MLESNLGPAWVTVVPWTSGCDSVNETSRFFVSRCSIGLINILQITLVGDVTTHHSRVAADIHL